MELPVKDIPQEFLKSIPKGIRLIKRNQKDFLLVESLFCPKGHELIVDSVRIHDKPSIKIKVTINNESGFLFIDSYWGSHAKLFSSLPPVSADETTYVEAFCPTCNISIIEHFSCPQEGCDSNKNILLLLPGLNNKIHVCAKLGCPGHQLEINDLPHGLVDSVSGINFFGAGVNEIFGGI